MRLLVLVLVAFCLIAPPAHPQKTYEVSEQRACTACSIRLERQATLSDAKTGGTFSDGASMSADRRGRIYVADHQVRHALLVFGPDGHFVASIGREGAGPGEFRLLVPPIDDAHGRLHIFDVMLRRRTVLDREYQLVTTIPTAVVPVPDYALLDSTRIVYNSVVRTPERAGLPLHIEHRGDLISFGSDQPFLRNDELASQRRILLVDRRGHLWAAHHNSYAVEVWSDSATLLERYERKAPWFEPWTRSAGPSTTHPPEPRITGISLDDHDRLWVLIAVADPEYLPIEDMPSHGSSLTAAQHDQLWGAVVEVIDTRTGKLIASSRTRRNLHPVKNGGVFFEYRESEAGEPLYDIWRPVLVDPSSTR